MRENIVEVSDLRSLAGVDFAVSQAVPEGAFGIFGPGVPLGSAVFAASDALAISPKLEPPPDPIPGWRISGSLWPGERYIIRVPKRWNRRLVVAGTPAQRSEFVNDLIWSDPLLARGYAYACGNKSQGEGAVILTGEEPLEIGGSAMPQFVAANGTRASFWQHAPGNTLERWMEEFFAIARLAGDVLYELHGTAPELTYAVGLSNGGNQVRHALEKSDIFAGGLAWNAVLWTVEHNLLRQLPAAVGAMDAGAPERLEELGFPPDVRGLSGASAYERNLNMYWIVTAWLYATLLDPATSIAYGDVQSPEPAESWNGRIGNWRTKQAPGVAGHVASYAHTGELRTKLIDLASAYDHLIPPSMHFHPYGRLVAAAGKAHLYRSELIPNAQHVDSWSEDPDFPQMQPGYPRVWAAFDELIAWVEG